MSTTTRRRLRRGHRVPVARVVVMGKGKQVVEYHDAESGEVRSGTIVGSGPEGVTIHDPESNRAVKVRHKDYWDPAARSGSQSEEGQTAEADAGGPASSPAPSSPGGASDAPSELELPGVEPGAQEDQGAAQAEPEPEEPQEGGDEPPGPEQRQQHMDRLDGLGKAGKALGVMRRRLADHLRMGGVDETAVHAVIVSLLDAKPVELQQVLEGPIRAGKTVQAGGARIDNPRAGAIVQAMRQLEGEGWRFRGRGGEVQEVGEETVDAYVQRVTGGVGLADLLSFRRHAEGVGELKGGGSRMLHSERTAAMDRAQERMHGGTLDPTLAEAFHQGHSYDAGGAGDDKHELVNDHEAGLMSHINRVRDADPWKIRGAPDEVDHDAGEPERAGPDPGGRGRR